MTQRFTPSTKKRASRNSDEGPSRKTINMLKMIARLYQPGLDEAWFNQTTLA